MDNELDDARECARDWAYKCELLEEKVEKLYDLLHAPEIKIALKYAVKHPLIVGIYPHAKSMDALNNLINYID